MPRRELRNAGNFERRPGRRQGERKPKEIAWKVIAMKKFLLFIFFCSAGNAFTQTPELQLITRAADALGGKERILSVKTLTIYGYGQQAYQNGGGNITASIDAPQKWVNINGLARTIDLEHGRMQLEQRLVQDFVFAYARNMNGDTRANQFLDGDIAFNVGADGRAVRAPEPAVRARRIECWGTLFPLFAPLWSPVQNWRTFAKTAPASCWTSPPLRATRSRWPSTAIPI